MTTSKPSAGELAPCPFCGGKAVIEEIPSAMGLGDRVSFSVGCNNSEESDCIGYQTLQSFALRGDAIKAWNTRSAPQAGADETGILQNDLREMLQALGMNDGAQPRSPHEVFQRALEEMKKQLSAQAGADMREALELQETAELAHLNCEECEGEEIPELCPKCFPLYDDARLARRRALASPPSVPGVEREQQIAAKWQEALDRWEEALNKYDQVRKALEQIKAVCTDNDGADCGHLLALRFVANVAARALIERDDT